MLPDAVQNRPGTTCDQVLVRMRGMIFASIGTLLLAIGSGTEIFGADQPLIRAVVAKADSSKATVHFGRDIQPIFAKRCLACHGPNQAKGGLRLDKKDRAFAELDSGERAIVPRQLETSELIARVTSTE